MAAVDPKFSTGGGTTKMNYRIDGYYNAASSFNIRMVPSANIEKFSEWLQDRDGVPFFEVTNKHGSDLISKPAFVDILPEKFDETTREVPSTEMPLYRVNLHYGTIRKELFGVPKSTVDDIVAWLKSVDTAPYFHCVGPRKESYVSKPLQVSFSVQHSQ